MMEQKYSAICYTTYNDVIPKMTFVQHDTASKIEFTLYEDIDVPMTGITSADVRFTRPDTNSYVFGMEYITIADNIITVTLPPASLYLDGKCSGSLSVYGADNERVTATQFTYTVKKEIDGSTPVDTTNEYPILTQLITDYTTEKTLITDNEATRTSNESSRIDAESSRVTAENTRVSAEGIRVSNEVTRQSNETTRQSTFSTNEANRGTTFTTNETNRTNTFNTNENTRQTNETNRIGSEGVRSSAEGTRITNEQNRQTNEAGRTNNETTRVANEASRVSAETTRVASESSRTSAESVRQTNETARQSAETTRVANYNTVITNYNNAVASQNSVEVVDARGSYSNLKTRLNSYIPDNIREAIPSGFTKLSDLDYIYMNTNTNQIKLLTDSVAFVNGYKITIPAATVITLSAPPVDIARDDLVFLEVWLDSTTGLPQYRLRVVDNVDFTKTPDGFMTTTSGYNWTTSIVIAQGGNASIPTRGIYGDYYTIVDGSYPTLNKFNDKGLFTAGYGDSISQTKLLTLDGYVYAIPMFKVHRRASTGYHVTGEYSKFSPLVSPLATQNIINNTQIAHTGDNSVQVTVNGNTLVNLLGSAGNCESLTGWAATGGSLDTTSKLFGTSSIKFVLSTNDLALIKDVNGLDSTHKYLFSSYINILSFTSGAFYLRYCDYNVWTGGNQYPYDTTKLNQWQRKSTIITGKSGIRIYVGSSGVTSTLTANIDGVMLYDLTAIYGAGNEPSDIPTLEQQLPFVDGVQSSKVVGIKAKGKNLFDTPRVLSANTGSTDIFTISGDTITINKISALTYLMSSKVLKLTPNVTFTMSVRATISNYSGSGQFYFDIKDGFTDTYISESPLTANANGTFTITKVFTVPNHGLIKIAPYISSTANGTFVFDQFQLEEGSVSTAYAPYKASQVITPSSVFSDLKKIGAVSDQIDLVRKKHIKKISDWVTMDGSWTFDTITNRIGFKYLRGILPISSKSVNGDYTSPLFTGIKYDNAQLKYGNTGASSDTIESWSGNVYCSVSNADTGLVDSYTPSTSEIKAYFYGWKMCNSDGSAWDGVATKYWKKITDGTGITSTLPTASYAGYTPYKMIYQFATPIETDITYLLKGRLYVNPELTTVETEQVSTQTVTPTFDGTNYIATAPVGTTAIGASRNGKDVFNATVSNNTVTIPGNMYQSGTWEVYYKEAPETHLPPDLTATIGTKTITLTNKATVGSATLATTDVGYKKTSEGAKLYNSIGAVTVPTGIAGMSATVTMADTTKIKIGDYIGTSALTYGVVIDITNSTTAIITALNAFSAGSPTLLNFGSRPDRLLADIVDTRDITNLRHQVSLTGFNYQQLLEQSFDSLLQGTL